MPRYKNFQKFRKNFSDPINIFSPIDSFSSIFESDPSFISCSGDVDISSVLYIHAFYNLNK